MKKLIVFSTLSFMASASFAEKINLNNIKDVEIYDSLIAQGHIVEQSFDRQYKKVTDNYQRENSSAQLVRTLETTPYHNHPNIADKQLYSTTRQDKGKVYKHLYEYSYMNIGKTNNWVLTKATSTFLHLKPIEEPDPSN